MCVPSHDQHLRNIGLINSTKNWCSYKKDETFRQPARSESSHHRYYPHLQHLPLDWLFGEKKSISVLKTYRRTHRAPGFCCQEIWWCCKLQENSLSTVGRMALIYVSKMVGLEGASGEQNSAGVPYLGWPVYLPDCFHGGPFSWKQSYHKMIFTWDAPGTLTRIDSRHRSVHDGSVHTNKMFTQIPVPRWCEPGIPQNVWKNFLKRGCFETITPTSPKRSRQFLSACPSGLLHWLVPNCPAHRWQKSFPCLPTLPCLFMVSWPKASLWFLIAMATTCPGFFGTFFPPLIQIFCDVVKPCVRSYARSYVLIWVLKYGYGLLPRCLLFVLPCTIKAKASFLTWHHF